jgi:hypothetical protein
VPIVTVRVPMGALTALLLRSAGCGAACLLLVGRLWLQRQMVWLAMS